MTGVLEVTSQCLDSPLRGGFIKEDEAALLIALFSVEPAEILVEAATELLESNLGDVLSGKVVLLQYGCEESQIAGMVFCDTKTQCIDDGLLSKGLPVIAPTMAPGAHGRTM